jgi:hypothetical protein
MPRCCLYLGDTNSGKTHLAFSHFSSELEASGRPGLIVDSFGANNFDSLRERYDCEGAADVERRLWDRGEHVIWSPRDCDELELMAEKIWKASKADPKSPVVLFIDETSPWLSPKYEPPHLTRLIRGHRHSDVTVFMTTQYCGDLPPVYWQCAHHIYLFRNTTPRALERIKLMLPGVDTEKIRTLPLREFVYVET